MALYEWKGNDLEPANKVTFKAEEREERHLQHALRDAPDILEEGLFIVAEEYSNWEESGRSIDLLALDAKRRLVVVELKRTMTGDHMDLQAVRYAAMVANMTFNQVVEAHKDYLGRRGQDHDNAAERIREHLGELGDEIDSSVPRILLASGDFSSELTTSVLWLNDNGLEIACVRLDLHRTSGGLYLTSSRVIPIPQAGDYQVRMRDKKKEQSTRASGALECDGAEEFRDSIRSAPKAHQHEIKRFSDWARTLQKEGVCSHFVTTFSARRDGYGLKPLLRRGKKHQRGLLISIYNPARHKRPGDDTATGRVWAICDKKPGATRKEIIQACIEGGLNKATAQTQYGKWNSGGPPRISVWKSGFEKFAPDSIAPVEQAMGHKIGEGNTVEGPITDELLEAFRQAYQEATQTIKAQGDDA